MGESLKSGSQGAKEVMNNFLALVTQLVCSEIGGAMQ